MSGGGSLQLVREQLLEEKQSEILKCLLLSTLNLSSGSIQHSDCLDLGLFKWSAEDREADE